MPAPKQSPGTLEILARRLWGEGGTHSKNNCSGEHVQNIIGKTQGTFVTLMRDFAHLWRTKRVEILRRVVRKGYAKPRDFAYLWWTKRVELLRRFVRRGVSKTAHQAYNSFLENRHLLCRGVHCCRCRRRRRGRLW